ncbi:MAG: dienelactone hydrolase family protein [Alphaproteobacteria bacterium]|nr:dienelactone hydrolase family protein [Alphaproteobacteria bacterium]
MTQGLQVAEYQIEVTTPDGTMPCHVAHPKRDRPVPTVLFFPNAAGIQDDTRLIARRFAARGYRCLLPNLYYRLAGFHVDMARLQGGGSKAEAEYRQMIRAAESVSIDMAMSDSEALLATTDNDENLDAESVASLGLSLGAGFALASAAMLDRKIAAVACFYGARLMTGEANSPHRLAAAVKAEILLGFAEIDPMTPPNVRQALAAALEQSACDHTIRTYAGTKHGFLDTNRPVYDPQAAAKAWRDVFDLYGRHLQPEFTRSELS